MFLIQCFSIIFIVFHYKDYVVFLIYYLQLLPIKNVENPDIFAVYPINIYSDTDYNKSILVEFTCNSNIMLSWFYSDFFPTKIKLWWLEKKTVGRVTKICLAHTQLGDLFCTTPFVLVCFLYFQNSSSIFIEATKFLSIKLIWPLQILWQNCFKIRKNNLQVSPVSVHTYPPHRVNPKEAVFLYNLEQWVSHVQITGSFDMLLLNSVT